MTLLLRRGYITLAIALIASALTSFAGERPYFITYDHTMEEPGNLEIESSGLTATPSGGDQFLSGLLEFEYGAKGWWTTEFYLDGQTTANQSAIFTGYRWENRFRMLMKEHRVNPVLYVEFEDINGADKTLKEVSVLTARRTAWFRTESQGRTGSANSRPNLSCPAMSVAGTSPAIS
jgi:hypothetical protein